MNKKKVMRSRETWHLMKHFSNFYFIQYVKSKLANNRNTLGLVSWRFLPYVSEPPKVLIHIHRQLMLFMPISYPIKY